MVIQPDKRDVFPAEIGRYIDVAAYVLDARAPASTLWLDANLAGRECFVLAKADLANPRATAAWIKYFAASGYAAFALDCTRGEGLPGFLEYIKNVYDAKSQEREALGILKTTIRLVALGVPNVGKSTFLNAILGRRRMRTGNRPGITRGHQWVRVLDGVDLLDTPGIIRETAHFRRARPLWLALNLLPLDEKLLEAAASVVLSALDRRARIKFEKLYGMEMPWGEGDPLASAAHAVGESPPAAVSPEPVAVKLAALKRLVLGKGIPDLARAYRFILRDFQQGKFGRISLERADTHAVENPVFGRK